MAAKILVVGTQPCDGVVEWNRLQLMMRLPFKFEMVWYTIMGVELIFLLILLIQGYLLACHLRGVNMRPTPADWHFPWPYVVSRLITIFSEEINRLSF
jgi:hypothetical protein